MCLFVCLCCFDLFFDVRAEIAAFAGYDGHDDVGHVGDFVEQLGDAEVAGQVHGVELLLGVERDDCYLAALLELDGYFGVKVCHGGAGVFLWDCFVTVVS